jgi:Tol biopolymer transport system component
MSLEPGSRLGAYEIQDLLGAGGMGEVYRARDTRLDRIVAIKVLQGHLSLSDDIRQRFEREARAISSLNHPNICTLFDVGKEGSTDYLVMEYVDGESLSDRLARGPIPVVELLPLAVQVADALDRAHRQGLIHRDLKPGNIMVTKSGAKLLDFGLARAAGLGAAPTGISSPTMSRPITAEGTIVGTFQYMAPEVLEGGEADARCDIFAFGAVLYEMATGRRAFEGKSQASLIAAIMERDPPPISSVQPLVSPALDRLVKTCMAKDPENRRQTMHDVLLELKWITEGGSQAGIPAPVAARRRVRARLAWAVASVMSLAAVTFAVGYFARAPKPAEAIRFQVPVGDMIISSDSPRISPDGRYLAFNAVDSTGTTLIWVRPLSDLNARPMPGTENARRPFWSPDSRYLAFMADRKLKKIAISGGTPQTICDAPSGADGSWGSKGVIIFDGSAGDTLMQVDASGGVPAGVLPREQGAGEVQQAWPHFLPDGEHFLYIASGAASNDGKVRVGTLGSTKSKIVANVETRVEYAAPGYIVYQRDQSLVAQPFDAKSRQTRGEPVPIVDQVSSNALGNVDFSLSQNGVLTYRGEAGSGTTRLVWMDRTGKEIGDFGDPAPNTDAVLSPDGRRLALVLRDPQTGSDDIWIRDLARGVTSRFTFDAASDIWPVWSPDGSTLAFTSNRSGYFALYARDAGGADEPRVVYKPDSNIGPTSWTPDGKTILCALAGAGAQWDAYAVPADGTGKAVPVLTTRFNEYQPVLSPNGRWLAYRSRESGRNEIYVRDYPGPGGRWQISTDGGTDALWRADGRELFYRSPNGNLMTVGIGPGASFDVGIPRVLFHAPATPAGFYQFAYTVTADGQRFLFTTPATRAAVPPTTVVVNWASAVGR